MDQALEKLLLSELRMAVCKRPENAVTDDMLTAAMTVNEELKNLGYTLRPRDLLILAGSSSLPGSAEHFRSLLPDVTAPPMYPDFPNQVMEMEEAQFRLHQLIHYFSTYGLETILGGEVLRGWLPSVESTEKTEEDKTLLDVRVLELVPEDEAALPALSRILGRRERLTLPGRELTALAVPYLEPDALGQIRIPFKENLAELFDAILEKTGGEKQTALWRSICKHTGDVIRSIESILPRHRYHFRTSQKKALVRLLESYPVKDLQANLVLSLKKRETSLVVLQYLDYNMYSRSPEHKEAVRALRNGELRSWQSRVEFLLASGDRGALDFIAERPGMLLRMISRLLRLGYPDREIEQKLKESAASLSLHTIVETLNALDRKTDTQPRKEVYHSLRQRTEISFANRQKALEISLLKENIRKRFEQRRKCLENWKTGNLKWIRKTDSLTAPEKAAKSLKIEEDYAEALRLFAEKEQRELTQEYSDRALRRLEYERRNALAELDREYLSAQSAYDRSAPYVDRVREILLAVLRTRMEGVGTELYGKKVWCSMQAYDLDFSRIEGGQRSSEGGYLPGGLAIRIPETVRRLRLFVYWNDKNRVDVDLHVTAVDTAGEQIHVGWNADFKKQGIIHSGDITHSDAAEYIDIDMEAPLIRADAVIDLFAGRPSFSEIETCYVGMMAVHRLKENVKLYKQANCFFTHQLRSGGRRIHYGYVDIQRRLLFFTGRDTSEAPKFADPGQARITPAPFLSLGRYLEILVQAQKAVFVTDPGEADLVLTMERSAQEGTVSLAEKNFFLEV